MRTFLRTFATRWVLVSVALTILIGLGYSLRHEELTSAQVWGPAARVGIGLGWIYAFTGGLLGVGRWLVSHPARVRQK